MRKAELMALAHSLVADVLDDFMADLPVDIRVGKTLMVDIDNEADQKELARCVKTVQTTLRRKGIKGKIQIYV